MVKIIETNLSMSETGTIKDHQSRLIEANSWVDYIDAFENYDGEAVEFKSLTSMIGNTINRENYIYNLEFDNFHLTCNVSNGIFFTKRLAYLIKQHSITSVWRLMR